MKFLKHQSILQQVKMKRKTIRKEESSLKSLSKAAKVNKMIWAVSHLSGNWMKLSTSTSSWWLKSQWVPSTHSTTWVWCLAMNRKGQLGMQTTGELLSPTSNRIWRSSKAKLTSIQVSERQQGLFLISSSITLETIFRMKMKERLLSLMLLP
jgi:hypothetical protein